MQVIEISSAHYDQALELLLGIVEAQPQGLSEYQLIERLEQAGSKRFSRRMFTDELVMFQRHFLLFHFLYVLRGRLREARRADLHIHCLDIRLLPYQSEGGMLPAAHDPLAAYYLDLSHLSATTQQDVRRLLGAFWLRLDAQNRRHEALEALGLDDPVEFTQIKRRYRRLVMLHHPDRGGDKAVLQRLNWAMDTLTRLERGAVRP